MRLKSGFVLHSIGSEHVVVPVDERTKEFHGMIRLNDTGAFLWKHMNDDFTIDTLMSYLEEEYDIKERSAAVKSIENIVNTLIKANVIINE